MVRKAPHSRLRDFVETATRIFTAKGYRRTQMADVTDALGLSSGSIYRYLDSKEALFDLAVRCAVEPDLNLETLTLPVPTPEGDATLEYVKRAVSEKAHFPIFNQALERETVADPREEFETVIRELFLTMAGNRPALNLVERCSLDRPELAVFWFEELRNELIRRLEKYLRRRIDGGWFRSVPSPLASARLIVEVAVFLAVDRHEDPFPIEMDQSEALETAVDTLLHTHLHEKYLSAG